MGALTKRGWWTIVSCVVLADRLARLRQLFVQSTSIGILSILASYYSLELLVHGIPDMVKSSVV